MCYYTILIQLYQIIGHILYSITLSLMLGDYFYLHKCHYYAFTLKLLYKILEKLLVAICYNLAHLIFRINTN